MSQGWQTFKKSRTHNQTSSGCLWSRAAENLGFSLMSFPLILVNLSFGETPAQVCCCHCLSPDTCTAPASFFLGATNLYLGYKNVYTVHPMTGCLGGSRIPTHGNTVTQVGFMLLWKDCSCLVSSKSQIWELLPSNTARTAGLEGILQV